MVRSALHLLVVLAQRHSFAISTSSVSLCPAMEGMLGVGSAVGYGPVQAQLNDIRVSPYGQSSLATMDASLSAGGLSAGGLLASYQQMMMAVQQQQQQQQSLSPAVREACQFYQKAGWCKFGDQCRYAHDSSVVAREKEPCQFFLKAGWCKWADQCKHSHVFSASATGQVAPQSIGQSALQPLGQSSVQPLGQQGSDAQTSLSAGDFIGVDGSPVLCKFFNAPGGCRSGESCRFKHTGEPGPAEGCQFYQRTGWCKYGDACKYVHDPSAVVATVPTHQPVVVPPPSREEREAANRAALLMSEDPSWNEPASAADESESFGRGGGGGGLGGDGSILAKALAKFAEAVSNVKGR